MSKTKRTQNKCKDCKYTWYPRGKDLSLKCPSCGGQNVEHSGSWMFLVGIVFLGFVIFVGTKEKKNTHAESSNTTDVAAITTENSLTPSPAATSLSNSIEPSAEVTSASTRSTEPTHMANNERVVTEEELAHSKKMLSESLLALQACSDHADDDQKNNCIAQECAKPELGPTQACANIGVKD